MTAELAMVGRMYIEEQRLRAWFGRIATSSGYNKETLQAMASQALSGESSDASPEIRDSRRES